MFVSGWIYSSPSKWGWQITLEIWQANRNAVLKRENKTVGDLFLLAK
jgi:hypothetical protein